MGRARMHACCPNRGQIPIVFSGTGLATCSTEGNVKNKEHENEHPGDVLGISNPGGPKLPHPPSDGSTPRGIEVRGERKRHSGIEDIPQNDGAAGIDMGGGGEGPQIASEPSSRRRSEDI
jgi:hypothetical protein